MKTICVPSIHFFFNFKACGLFVSSGIAGQMTGAAGNDFRPGFGPTPVVEGSEAVAFVGTNIQLNLDASRLSLPTEQMTGGAVSYDSNNVTPVPPTHVQKVESKN
jgi:hypothetical protein